jgi:hypothetical protein
MILAVDRASGSLDKFRVIRMPASVSPVQNIAIHLGVLV